MHRALPLFVAFVCGCAPEKQVFDFAPQGSELKVTFPGAFVESETTGVGGLFSRQLTLKVATRGDRSHMFRADTATVTPNEIAQLTAEGLKAYGISFGQNQGLESTSVQVQDRSFGKCLEVRGNKPVEGQPHTFFTRMCFGKHTMLTQYVAAHSSIFPPVGSQQFLDSLKPV